MKSNKGKTEDSSNAAVGIGVALGTAFGAAFNARRRAQAKTIPSNSS